MRTLPGKAPRPTDLSAKLPVHHELQAERWRHIEALFEAALAQSPEKRAAFVAEAYPDDPQFRGELESLLAPKADSFLKSAPVSAIKALSARQAG